MDIEIRFRISCSRFSNWSRGYLEVPVYGRNWRGGAFFLIFIGFTLLIGLPLLLAEFVIGRSTQKEAVDAYREIAPKTLWPWLGKLGIVTCFILLSFYSVVGGWILLYLWNAITGRLWEGNGAYEATFGEIISIRI